MPDRLHGVFTTGAGATGLVQSLSFAETGKEVLIQDETGKTIEEQHYDGEVNVSATLVFDRDNSASVPAKGDQLTLANCLDDNHNGIYTVVDKTLAEGNNEAPTYDFTLRRFLDGNTPATT